MQMRDVWQRFVTSGADFGICGAPRRTFWITVAAVAVNTAVVDTLAVISTLHGNPHLGLLEPVIWEGSSWVTLVLSFVIIWGGYWIAPPNRLSWRLLFHVPFALAFFIGHVGGFVLLRKIAYWAMGSRYVFGPFWPNVLYEAGKDSLAYGLTIAALAFVSYLVRQQRRAVPRLQTFDIRDGTKLNRVLIENILAVSSAGNYAEFSLRDGRTLCMRSSLSALERELAPHGFLRSHRSWLVNAAAVTALRAEGSGDYAVSLGALTVPLSRRFPATLAKLRAQ